MKHTLIQNGYIITMNPNKDVYAKADILIEDDHIKEIGHVDRSQISPDADILDAAGKIVMPGLVNTHVHLSQQLARGLADDVDLLTWLRERIWPYESEMTLEDSYISSLACCTELIRSGVTCFAEAGGQEVDGMGRAVTEAGLRGILCRSTMDQGEGLPKKWQESTDTSLDKQIALYNKWHNQAEGRIRYWFGIRTMFNASDELMVRTKELADKYHVGIHMHVAEVEEEIRFAKASRGASTVEHLANLGILDRNLLAVHTVWLTDREIDFFKLYDVKVSHNPGAAMKVVLGFARIPEMLQKGIPVSIGTDGAPSNNRMDMMDEMYLTSLIHKGRTLDPKVVPAEQVIEMATMNGAKSLLWDDEIGSLEVNKKADLIILDPHAIGSIPLHDPVANVVYGMHASNVTYSMCNGKWLMKEKQLMTIDEEKVLHDARRHADAIVKRAGITLPHRMKPCE